MKWLKKLFTRIRSNSTAKNRLINVLSGDRLARAPGLLQKLENELKKLIADSLQLEPEAMGLPDRQRKKARKHGRTYSPCDPQPYIIAQNYPIFIWIFSAICDKITASINKGFGFMSFFDNRRWKNIEYFLPIIVIVISLIGLLAILIATTTPFSKQELSFDQIIANLNFEMVLRQAKWLVIALAVMIGMMFISYRFTLKYGT